MRPRKLSDEQVAELRKELASPDRLSYRKLGAKYGMTGSAIIRIKTGEIYKGAGRK